MRGSHGDQSELTPRPDRPLIEGENPDIRREAYEVAGEDWIHLHNDLLGSTPEELIRRGRIDLVRDALRLIRFAGST